VSGLVLDAGALIALERDSRTVWAALKVAAMTRVDVLVPSTALAQVWRHAGRQAVLARVLRDCVVASFDEMAKQVGELCGTTRTTDICDAHVALVAATRGDTLYTSDPGDLRRLLAHCGPRSPIIVRC
jgi:hypothetical protein